MTSGAEMSDQVEPSADVRDSIALEREAEQLRQERETFNQLKVQDNRWFLLRLVMGSVAVVLFPAIMFVCTWIIFHHQDFSSATVTVATTGLLGDSLGLVIAIWKLVLGTRGPERLAPVTQAPTRSGQR
jgi:lipid-A-disaccharide synthase-like uncharacterized protein